MRVALPRLLARLLPWLAVVAVVAHAQSSPTRYSAPAGWALAREAEVELLSPPGEPVGTVQLMLLATKPAQGDFNAQFERERAALESHWGLRAPQAVPLQSGQAAAGSYAAYFASFDSEGGARYLGFMALGDGRRFAMWVFVASGHEAFNRLAPQAVGAFKTLSLNP